MAIIFVIVLGSIIILLGIANGFRKAGVVMPLAGNCGTAISPACHPPKADVDASSKRVMWSLVAEEDFKYFDESIGHFSFTSFGVDAPTMGEWYAGR